MNPENDRQDRVRAVFAVLAFIATLLSSSIARSQYILNDRSSCHDCHSNKEKRTDFCDRFEAAIYDRDDKHAQAFKLLHESDSPEPQRTKKRELVHRMLGFDLGDVFEKDGDGYSKLRVAGDNKKLQHQIDTVKACLRCHATWPTDADKQSPRQPPVLLSLGVSCQACHGPGESWLTPHQLEPFGWRLVAAEAKSALGFYDVRSVEKKSQRCASCHVGNIAEERFVKHEWYAAGHPPLPSFELASFEEQMPLHWKSLSEKSDFKIFRRGQYPRDDEALTTRLESLRGLFKEKYPQEPIRGNYLEANSRPDTTEKNSPRTRDVVVAGATVLEMYVRLVQGVAGKEVERQKAKTKEATEGGNAPASNDGGYGTEEQPGWPELAIYDCTACHHELRSGQASNSRPRRNHPPGRPPLATWPMVLTRLAVEQSAGYDAVEVNARWSRLTKQLGQLEYAATKRPFGDPETMQTAATTLATTLEELAQEVAKTQFDKEAARHAVEVLTDPEKYETKDFYTARQAAWAIAEIARDLGSNDVMVLFARNSTDPLALELPSGPRRSVMDNLRRWLPAAANYEADWFHKELETVPKKLPPP